MGGCWWGQRGFEGSDWTAALEEYTLVIFRDMLLFGCKGLSDQKEDPKRWYHKC